MRANPLLPLTRDVYAISGDFWRAVWKVAVDEGLPFEVAPEQGRLFDPDKDL